MQMTENIYYNMSGTHPIGDLDPPLSIQFNENRVSPILEVADHYEVAVNRFSLPSALPIMIWPEDPNVFRITLRWDTSEVTRQIIFTDQCTGCAYPRGIYNIEDALENVNDEIRIACVALKLLDPAFPYTGADSFFFFEPSTQLTDLYTPQNLVDPLFKFVMSIQLYEELFSGIQSSGDFSIPSFPRVELVLSDKKLNRTTIDTLPYIKTQSTFPTIPNDALSLQFLTDLPVVAELEGGSLDVTQKVLTDFNLDGSINDRTGFQYFPQGPLRWNSMKSSQPLTTISLRVMVTFKNGKQYPLLLERGASWSVKLQFRHVGRR
jgi:hypothetical protein